MGTEKDLLSQAIGHDEPPLGLDFDALERDAARSRRLRSRLVVAGVATAVVAVAGGAFLATSTTGSTELTAANSAVPLDPPNQELAYCYRDADITSDAIKQHVPVGISGADRDGHGNVTVAIMGICQEAWKTNDWGFGAAGQPVPTLIACVLNGKAVKAEEGAVGVFPGNTDTCASLGLRLAKI